MTCPRPIAVMPVGMPWQTVMVSGWVAPLTRLARPAASFTWSDQPA